MDLEKQFMPVSVKADEDVDEALLENYKKAVEHMNEAFEQIDNVGCKTKIDSIMKIWHDSHNIWRAQDPGMIIQKVWMESMAGGVGIALYKARVQKCLPSTTADVEAGFVNSWGGGEEGIFGWGEGGGSTWTI